MKEKNYVIELLEQLVSNKIFIYSRMKVIKSEKFSEILQFFLNEYC